MRNFDVTGAFVRVSIAIHRGVGDLRVGLSIRTRHRPLSQSGSSAKTLSVSAIGKSGVAIFKGAANGKGLGVALIRSARTTPDYCEIQHRL